MGYSAVFSNGRVSNMVKRFVIDTESDLQKIDISQLSAGSRAFVIATSKTYMLDTSGKWVSVTVGSGSGSSGSGGIDGDIIYDGGDLENPNADDIYYDGGNIDDGG